MKTNEKKQIIVLFLCVISLSSLFFWKLGIDTGTEKGYDSGYQKGYYDGYQQMQRESEEIQQKYYELGYENGFNDANSGYLIDLDTGEIITTYDNDRETVEETVYITETGRKYHKYGCQYLRESCISISLYDAIDRGYTPCSVCW